jgi:hypothetical protein
MDANDLAEVGGEPLCVFAEVETVAKPQHQRAVGQPGHPAAEMHIA